MDKKTQSIDILEEEVRFLRRRVEELEAAQSEPAPPKKSGESLASQSLIADVFNAAQDAIFVKDLDGRYLIINEIGARMLGHEVDYCIGKDDTELFPEESAKKIRENDLEVIRGGEPSMIEEAVQTALGEITFLSIKGPFRDESGAIIGMFGISRDITERMVSAQALRLNEERLNLAQTAGQFGTWDWDVVNKVGTCSPEYSRFFGLEEDGTMPCFDDWLELVHPDDQDRVSNAIFDAHINHAPYHVEYRIALPDETIRWVEARATILSKSDGSPLRVVGVVSDVTHQKEEEARLERLVNERTRELQTVLKALRRSEKRYRVLFNGLDDGLLVHDFAGNILDCNDALCRQLNYTREELLSMNTVEIDGPEFAAGFKSRLSSQLEGGCLCIEGTHITRDGRTIPIDVNSRKMNYLGQEAVLSLSRDISRRKQAEAEREALEEQVRHTQKLESLGLLAGGIAHDFNNLLVGVMGHTEMAQELIPDEHAIHYELSGIMTAAERAADLCNQMLAYSGKGQFVVRVLDINEAVHDISKLLRASLNKKVRLDFNLNPRVPAVEADPAQVTQLVLNLLTNAAEAIGDNKGVISLQSRTAFCDRAFFRQMVLDDELAEGNYVVLSVTDNGSGMDEETVARIFDPFFTTKFTGRGLGLAAVIGIVRGHKGALQVRSNLGEGTRFDVYLPASNQKVSPAPTPRLPTLADEAEDTILLVDDEPSVLNIARRMLERKGYRVLTATNGKEAIEVFTQHQHEIKGVVLDLTMPELNGRETFHELRQIDAKVRVLISSGFSSQEATRDFGSNANVGFVQKPYQSQLFYAKIQQMLTAEV